jgi:hypothetical protein
MRSTFFIAAAIALSSALTAQSGAVTLSGHISDSLCKAKHEEAAEGAGKMSNHDCTVSCVRGGSKYVLLTDGAVYQIANQAFAGPEAHAGEHVKVTGELHGDTITVSNVEPIPGDVTNRAISR